jgi:predicted dehydrogenase
VRAPSGQAEPPTFVRVLVRLRVGVVGGGLIAQAMHLPYLRLLSDRFETVALADPSARVRAGVARRFGISTTYPGHGELLQRTDLDAVLICAPAAAHAETALAALDAGVHVFVEKPMCLTVAAADDIVKAAREAGRVVQVGYMNRFDPAYERMHDELPESAEGLRYVSVVVNDPEFEPYFGEDEDLIRPDDIPPDALERLKADESDQVQAAVGTGDPDSVRAFSDGFLGSLVHQVNLVHGLLDRMGERAPATVIGGDWWAGGRALTGSVRLSGGARWDSAWVQLVTLHEYEERVILFFEDSIRSLLFPSPWLKQSPTVYRLSRAADGGRSTRSFEAYRESFQRQLIHFHDCVVNGAECRTPPEQARADIEVLTRMFLAAREPAMAVSR